MFLYSSSLAASCASSSSLPSPCTAFVKARHTSIPPFKVALLIFPTVLCAIPGSTPSWTRRRTHPAPTRPRLAHFRAAPSISWHAPSNTCIRSACTPSSMSIAVMASIVSHRRLPCSCRFQTAVAISSPSGSSPMSPTCSRMHATIFLRAVTTLLPLPASPVHCHRTWKLVSPPSASLPHSLHLMQSPPIPLCACDPCVARTPAMIFTFSTASATVLLFRIGSHSLAMSNSSFSSMRCRKFTFISCSSAAFPPCGSFSPLCFLCSFAFACC